MIYKSDMAGNLAIFSDCEQYRYLLTRNWGRGPGALWVMLNPSTADESQDDPTITRCIRRTMAERHPQHGPYGRLEICNLFAFRATDPAVMKAQSEPVGQDNDRVIAEALTRASLIVLAWGENGAWRNRADEVMRLLADKDCQCLGRTQGGHPRHPLYVAYNKGFEPFVEVRA